MEAPGQGIAGEGPIPEGVDGVLALEPTAGLAMECLHLHSKDRLRAHSNAAYSDHTMMHLWPGIDYE